MVGRYIETVNSLFSNKNYPFLEDRYLLSLQFKTALQNAFSSISGVDKNQVTQFIEDSLYDNYPQSIRQYLMYASAAKKTGSDLSNMYALKKDNDKDGANTKLIYIHDDAKTRLSGLQGIDSQGFSKKSEITTQIAIEMQELDQYYIENIAPADVSIYANKNTFFNWLLDYSGDSIPDIEVESYDSSIAGVDKIRYSLTREFVNFELLEENIANKNYLSGTNSIGFKTPYLATLAYDDTFTRNWKWPQDKDKYLDYFKYFGGYGITECAGVSCASTPCCEGYSCSSTTKRCEAIRNVVKPVYTSKRYVGLLPEVNKYYLTMVRDRTRTSWWMYDAAFILNPFNPFMVKSTAEYWNDVLLSQPNIRFHLVSPCKADLMMKVSRCECFGSPTDKSIIGTFAASLGSPKLYQTGENNEDFGTFVDNFDGENPMLYKIDKDTGQITKECMPKSIWANPPWNSNAPYKPMCIEINPIIDPEVDPNYCYQGYKPLELKAFDFAMDWGIPLACAAVSGTAGTAAGGVGAIPGFIAGYGTCATVTTIVDLTVGEAFDAACYKWPHRGGNTGGPCCMVANMGGAIPALLAYSTGNCEEYKN
jgi:hypothetical protein